MLKLPKVLFQETGYSKQVHDFSIEYVPNQDHPERDEKWQAGQEYSMDVTFTSPDGKTGFHVIRPVVIVDAEN